jgi:hypothetical protein
MKYVLEKCLHYASNVFTVCVRKCFYIMRQMFSQYALEGVFTLCVDFFTLCVDFYIMRQFILHYALRRKVFTLCVGFYIMRCNTGFIRSRSNTTSGNIQIEHVVDDIDFNLAMSSVNLNWCVPIAP